MFEPRNSSTLLLLTLIIVTVAHLYSGSLKTPGWMTSTDETTTDTSKSTPIVVENWVNPTPEDDRQVVQSSRAEEDPDAKEAKAKFLGEFRNRVKKEMQSADRGRYRQGGPAVPPQGFADGEESLDGMPRGREDLHLKDLMPYAMSPHQLGEGIEKGGDTILNTDPVLYAAFLNRIADSIYDSWSYFANIAITDYRRHGELRSNLYVTNLTVVLDREGTVTEIRVTKGSGIDLLDEAPRKAFWESRAFPNPPKQLLGADGFVHLKYQFYFEVKNSAFGIGPLTI